MDWQVIEKSSALLLSSTLLNILTVTQGLPSIWNELEKRLAPMGM